MRATTVAGVIALAHQSLAATHDYWHNITYLTTNPDGKFDKQYTVGVNGTWPPPIVNVNYNDTVTVHAINGLGDGPTSVHHHGLYFNGSNYYDGAPGVTQCGIPPGQSLDYHVPVDRQWGTYWWHSHTGVHYQDGLRAPLIIHAPEEPHKYDEEYVIVLSDWYHERAEKENKVFMSKYNPTGAEPVPDSLLIYAAKGDQYLPSNENVKFNDDLAIPFEAGKTYRLRIINAGIFSMNYFWIDGHEMRIIEADGTDIEEFPVDHLTLSVAQRYSVLVTARNTTDSNFLIHAMFDETMFDTVPDGLVVNYTSSISYGEGLPMAPAETRDELTLMQDHLMVPIIKEEQFTPTKSLELDVYFDTFDNGINRASMFDNITWVAPKTPSLMSMLSMGEDAMDVSIYGQQTAAQVLSAHEVVDLMIINFDGNGHPFHLHGHKFQITRVAQDVTSDDPELNPPHTLHQANPMTRDTIIVPAGGAVNIAFRADNPGAWIFHCHIQWHMEAGLAVVFMEDPLGAQRTMTLPQQITDQCAALGISSTGNAAGKMSTTDLKGAPKGPLTQEHITGWTPRAKGALAGCVITALLGMLTVVWYAVGGQLDADELEEEVQRKLEEKRRAGGGLIKRGFNVVTGKNKRAEL
ncbi:uncharacterized protein JCM15063_004427 [Sporobolomyces koalae]|uniref:uncharacterized protein n=1 Tax=Sporobolomyces koalae TaxID=500713 RepID=UPI00316F5DD0